MMQRMLLALLVSLFMVAPGTSPSATQQATRQPPIRGPQDRLVGTWKLVNVEETNAQGEVIQPAAGAPDRTGYIIYDSAGYMAVSIMPVARKKYAGVQPTDEEALATITGYTAYFGTFTVDAKERAVTHHLQGSVDPGMGTDQKRMFEFSGNRLTLKAPAARNGNQQRLTWERIPDITDPTAEQRRFVGFWKLISNEQRNQKGEVLSSNPGQFGYIIYTRAGFMTVHMVQPGRKPYASQQPTASEAGESLRTYSNYFGPFYVHESDGYVVHDQVGELSAGRASPSPQKRYYRFAVNRLLLQPPPTYTADDTIQGTITWEHVGATAAP